MARNLKAKSENQTNINSVTGTKSKGWEVLAALPHPGGNISPYTNYLVLRKIAPILSLAAPWLGQKWMLTL